MTAPERDSLERIVPDQLESGEATGADTLRLHRDRYAFAGRHLPAGGTVLDLACGVGYGSQMLASQYAGRRLVGADLSRGALRHATAHYRSATTAFVQGDGAGWVRAGSIDGAVSLETLEHVPDPGALFADLVAAVRPGGVFVASVPVTPSVDANPHHRTDFTERSFLALGRGHGLEVVARFDQRQGYSPVAVVTRSERRTRDLRRGLAGYYLRHPSALARRLVALARFGFTNRYLTVAWRKPPA